MGGGGDSGLTELNSPGKMRFCGGATPDTAHKGERSALVDELARRRSHGRSRASLTRCRCVPSWRSSPQDVRSCPACRGLNLLDVFHFRNFNDALLIHNHGNVNHLSLNNLRLHRAILRNEKRTILD